MLCDISLDVSHPMGLWARWRVDDQVPQGSAHVFPKRSTYFLREKKKRKAAQHFPMQCSLQRVKRCVMCVFLKTL